MPTAVANRTLQQLYEAKFAGSRRRYEQAKTLFPDGVTHDLRKLEPFPVYVSHALGARKWDVDGHELIDYWSGHGSLLLGHCHPDVVAAVQRQAGLGTHLGGCHDLEIEWGALVQKTHTLRPRGFVFFSVLACTSPCLLFALDA